MNLLSLVKEFEGFHRLVRLSAPPTAEPYLCPAAFWTIGYGHLCERSHPPITEPAATDYLVADLAIARAAVDRLITRPLTTGQADALTSWTMNLGAHRLRGSTLRAVINRGEMDRAVPELRRWVYAGGVKLAGLVARREAEALLFRSAI